MADLYIDPDFSGHAALLQDGRFSDITLELPGGGRICVHRAILAAASDVLSAKFSSPTRDAAEDTWRPEKGSATAWQWLIGWMYGKREAVPWDHLVEIFVLADYLQLNALLASSSSIDLHGNGRNIVHQLLDVKDCPLCLDNIAAKCVPACAFDTELWTKLMQASLPIVRLFLKSFELHPLLTTRASDEPVRYIEECVLVLLGARLRAEDGMEFSDCLVDAIRWDAFPAELLKQAVRGDVSPFRQFLNADWVVASANAKEHIALAAVSRCERLEKRGERDPLQGATEQGLFSRMRENGMKIEAALSSRVYGNDLVSVLTSRSYDASLGTHNQSDANRPWIELKSGDAMIHPRAVGLCHGYGNGTHCCKTVVEAAVGDGEWKQLLEVGDKPVSTTCEVHSIPPLPLSEAARHEGFFDRFRIRMTGPNSNGSWQLLISWFDIFGIAASSEAVATLKAATEFAPSQPEGAAGSEEPSRL